MITTANKALLQQSQPALKYTIRNMRVEHKILIYH